MCVIIGTIEREKISQEVLRKAWQTNSDGAGIAWRKNGKVYVIKGLMKQRELLEVYQDVDTFPHIVHFRLGTSGGNLPELTHPFPCGKMKSKNPFIYESDSVLFHNGVVSGWETLLFTLAGLMSKREYSQFLLSPINDTKVVAKYVEKTTPEILHHVTGKWCYFSSNQTLLYGQSWIKDEKFFYSNKAFETAGYGYFSRNTFTNNGLWRPGREWRNQEQKLIPDKHSILKELQDREGD